MEGEFVYDRSMKVLDPKLVKMQFQVWVVKMGVDPVAVIEKYPGRICSLHLQDYSPETKAVVAIGKGAAAWKPLFAAARKADLKNYYVAMDLTHERFFTHCWTRLCYTALHLPQSRPNPVSSCLLQEM